MCNFYYYSLRTEHLAWTTASYDRPNRAGIYRIGDGRHLILMLLKHHRITVDDTVFNQALVLLHYYRNSPPNSKSWIRAWWHIRLTLGKKSFSTVILTSKILYRGNLEESPKSYFKKRLQQYYSKDRGS